MRKALACTLLAVVLSAAPTVPATAGQLVLLSHRANYELNLVRRSDATAVSSARGMMAMTVEETCDAWRVRQGLALTIGRDEQQIATVSDFDSEEAKDGSWYSFDDRTHHDPGGEEHSTGMASIQAGSAGRVEIRAPQHDEAVLPAGTVFPMAHLTGILEAALAGERMVSHVLFDGTDGPRIYQVTTLIGPATASQDGAMRAWPVRLAFFAADSAVETPDLEIDVRLREDGVAEALIYDYGNFVLAGTLTSLEPMAPPDC